MKYSALITFLIVASASAFAPANNGRVSTSLSAKKQQAAPEKKSIARRVFDLDLFSPVADQNDYGARSKKKIVTGKITANSYIPSGLTQEQYNKLRADERAAKENRYKEKMSKAGKFEDFTEWYRKRGTDLSGKWIKSATLGHNMVKTKYDWSGFANTAFAPKKAEDTKTTARKGGFKFGSSKF